MKEICKYSFEYSIFIKNIVSLHTDKKKDKWHIIELLLPKAQQ